MIKTISIIVPCYNEERTISLLLDALKNQTFCSVHPEQVEIIIADGMSTDATIRKILEWSNLHREIVVKIVENPRRIIPAALNSAIASSEGKYIVRLDAHSVPALDYVERCVALLEQKKGDNIGGRWEIQPSADQWMARGIAAAAGSRIGAGDAKYRYSEEAGFVDTVPFGAYQRETLIQIGGYDESLPVNEDYDLNVRIRRNGGKIWFDPSIRCVYFARSSFSKLAKQYWRYGFWKLNMLKKDPKSIRIRQMLPPLFVLSLIILSIGYLFSSLCSIVLSLELIIYIMILLLFAIRIAGKKNDLTLLAGFPIAIIVMHLAWGGGFLWSCIQACFNQIQRPPNKK